MDDIEYLIRSAVRTAAKELVESSKYENDPELSEEFEQKMQTLCDQYDRKLRRRKPRFYRQLIAVAVVAAALIGALSANAFLPQIYSFILSMNEKYMILGHNPETTPLPFPQIDLLEGWNAYWYPTYLPDGYTITSASKRSSCIIMTFAKADYELLSFHQAPGSRSMISDSEAVLVPNIMVKDYDTSATEKSMDGQTLRTLSWSNGTTYFSLSGTPSFETLVKIAENIIFIEVDAAAP